MKSWLAQHRAALTNALQRLWSAPLNTLLTLLVIALRRQLWARFAVEPAALLDEDVRAGRISSF